MRYAYENLTPDKFQQLCQALIVREFPGTRCFPVGQADAGRDAIAPALRSNGHFTLFQVKFVRDPLRPSDARNWLMQTARKELPKVTHQISKGATRYVLVTNVQGSAKAETGSIDKLDKLLEEHIGIPAVCWWRDDLDRRLDNAWDLKWVYPEVMTGPDLIRYLIEEGLSEEQQRRSAAVRAFIRTQFEIDEEVKFKQVELQNKHLDLFVDIPVMPPSEAGRRAHEVTRHRTVYNIVAGEALMAERAESDEVVARRGQIEHEADDRGRLPGAASLLLHPLQQQHVAKIVLEGAPGQGKSTIGQYICQVHRMKLLEETELLGRLPEDVKTAPVRMPIKAELRDLDTWLGGKNPFASKSDSEVKADQRERSLESFLAALIQHYSGGVDFTVADLLAVGKVSATLLVLDGLDEVADIARRQQVVEEVVKGVGRLNENLASLQVVVTSRPAAFANSPGLPERDFAYYHLASLTRPLIDEYTNLWLRARKVMDREADEVRRILGEKLDQPHVRDLARNPMQLTILLSLIHTKGSSLPDKRTSLYDSYVELFFSRESEKSAIVRQHRDLLTNIHRYLAWVLHSQAEVGGNGTIAEEKLRELLREYLASEGYDAALCDVLFSGMVERVVAVVSRVQGTYEFEVQPLREYFVARYLYETAPYSPPGGEKRGTMPDRFDAIARNPYWLNVARFYAGCYSKGELASLIESLRGLTQEMEYAVTAHPRLLGSTLLSDWVFSQQPKSVSQATAVTFDGVGLRLLLTANRMSRPAVVQPSLPDECGRSELRRRCVEILDRKPPWDFMWQVLRVLHANSSPNEIDAIWSERMGGGGRLREAWMEYSVALGTLQRLSLGALSSVFKDEKDEIRVLTKMFRAGRTDYIHQSKRYYRLMVEAILARAIMGRVRTRDAKSPLELLAEAMGPHRYTRSFQFRGPVPLGDILSRFERGPETPMKMLDHSALWTDTDDLSKQIRGVVDVVRTEEEKPSAVWATQLEPWDRVVESVRSIWGDNWACYHLANLASGIKSQNETCTEFADLFDTSTSLCRRARYARLRAGSEDWWRRQVEGARNEGQLMFVLLLLGTWASMRAIIELVGEIGSALDRLTDDGWARLHRSWEQTLSTLPRRREATTGMSASRLNDQLSPRAAVLLNIRGNRALRIRVYKEHLASYDGDDHIVLQSQQSSALELGASGRVSWRKVLPVVAKSYGKKAVSLRYLSRSGPSLNTPIAQEICTRADEFPTALLEIAEDRCRGALAGNIIPIREIADRDGWFDE